MDNIYVLAINVPNSLLRPGVLRKKALLQNAARFLPNLTIHFLERVCTSSEVVESVVLRQRAQTHDTFVAPPLCKKVLDAPASAKLTDLQKSLAYAKVAITIWENWDRFLDILQKLNFQCRDLAQVEKFVQGDEDAQTLSWYLDAVRTMLTRTACTESHRRVYQAMAKRSESVGLLLEDDLSMLPGIEQQIQDILAWLKIHDPNWDIVQLGYSKHQGRPIDPIESSPLARATQGAYGNTAVLVNLANSSAQRILDILQDSDDSPSYNTANDVTLAESDKINRYVATKRLVGPPPGDHLSVLTGTTMNYDSFCWDPEQLEELKSLQSELSV